MRLTDNLVKEKGDERERRWIIAGTISEGLIRVTAMFAWLISHD